MNKFRQHKPPVLGKRKAKLVMQTIRWEHKTTTNAHAKNAFGWMIASQEMAKIVTGLTRKFNEEGC